MVKSDLADWFAFMDGMDQENVADDGKMTGKATER